MKIETLSTKRRVLLAKTLVFIQFLILGIIGVDCLTKVSKSQHSYLAMEIVSISLGILIISSAALILKPSLRISPIPKSNAPLISSGIYRYVRHPMYLGVILIGFGMAGYADSVLGWIAEMLLILELNIKARFEDALLCEIHPESVHYQLHVSRLLPCVGGSCRTNCITE